MKRFPLFLFSIVVGCYAHAQITKESTKVDYIKSIQFLDLPAHQQFPVIKRGEQWTLSFDDLLAEDNDYYYRIRHFNADWTPSTLFQNQYLGGFDNQRIDNFSSSYNTLQRYNNYQLTLPNQNTQFLASGNYMVEVYDFSDQLVFSRKFLVLDEKTQVQVGVFPPQDVARLLTHQNLQFTITPLGFQLRNPNNDITVVILQNSQWNSRIVAPDPQYTNGNQLIYRYTDLTLFEGGNEYLNLDTKDIASTTPMIGLVERGERYEHYLYPALPRKNFPYTYSPDIDGNFIVNTLQGNDSHIEADYSEVYFQLARQYALEDEEVYIYGKFNNYALDESNKMIFNPQMEVYEGILLLKQGFYDYNFVLKKNGELHKNALSGSHAATENHYLVLVYHRGIGDLYDTLIGVGEQQSFALSR